MVQELLVLNVALNPKYPPKKISHLGAMLRPVIGNRALPPRGIRYLKKTELSAAIVADLKKGMEHGALAVRFRVGSTRDLSIEEIMALAGITVQLPPPVQASVISPLVVDGNGAPEAASEETEPVVEEVLPVAEAVAEVAAPEETPVEEAPIEALATLDDLLTPEPLTLAVEAYTEGQLGAFKSDHLSEILVSKFAYPTDQLYRLKTKQAKIDEILARQGA